MKISIIILLTAVFYSFPVLAYDYKKCFGMVNKHGFFKKYDFNYAGPWWITCRTSGKESSILVTTKVAMERSTISMDPGISTGEMTGSAQFSSTWGECSIMGDNGKMLQREMYIAENIDQIQKEVAFGKGEYLDTLAYLSNCHPATEHTFASTLQKNYAILSSANTADDPFSRRMDQILKDDRILSQSCLNY